MEIGNGVSQQCEFFSRKIGLLNRQTGDVPTWSRETSDESIANRVRCHREDDRDIRRGPLCREGRHGARRDNNIHLQPGELGCNLSEAVAASFRPAILHRDGAAFDPAELT
jgi:hypothetical protein